MKKALSQILLVFIAVAAEGRTLPGMKIIPIARVQEGFLTGLAFDSSDHLFYSVLAGKVFRLENGQSTLVTTLPSANEGNAGLLGIAIDRSDRIVAHYVTSDLTSEVLSRYDPADGATTTLVSLKCLPDGRPSSAEHHGGNPALGPNGEIYFGVGDFANGPIAQSSDSPGGKIIAVYPDGSSQVFAKGFRNPYDLGFNQSTRILMVGDNGAVGEDELNAIELGENAGWPLTAGDQAPVAGTTPPIYVYPSTVAPTGLALYPRAGVIPKDAVLQASFVKKALYLFPDTSLKPLPAPIEMIAAETAPIIDVTTDSQGTIYFATGMMIYRLALPQPGDADGNGTIDDADLQVIAHEIVDGDGSQTVYAQNGSVTASWGADVNGDGIIDARDLVLFVHLPAMIRSHGARR